LGVGEEKPTGPSRFAHPEVADHTSRQLGGTSEVVARSAGGLAQHEELAGAAAETNSQGVEQDACTVLGRGKLSDVTDQLEPG